MTFKEFLKTCPKNGNYFLLESYQEPLKEVKIKFLQAVNTNGSILVFNKQTESSSRKSVYRNSKGDLYVKDSGTHKKSQMLFLKDFK